MPVRVLILEDRPADAVLMVQELRRAGFDPVWRRVDTEEDYLTHLQAQPDVILADYSLPQFNALRALQLLQERGGDTPFLIVSATIGEELAVSAMQQGAADYLLKDRLARLGPAVQRALHQVAERRARQQAEAALRASEVRFRSMAEAAPGLLWMAGEDRGYTYCNQGWLAFTGRTMAEELGTGWTENLHPDDAGACLELYARAFMGRQPLELEYRLRRADGVYRWVLSRGVPMLTPEGRFTGYLGLAIDITARKEAEQILQQTQEELERRVAERTAALQQAMVERQRLEREAQRVQHFALLGRLAAGVSHEIRNPLGAVFLHFDLLQEILRTPAAASPEELADTLSEIQTNLARVEDLVQDYLSLVRVTQIERTPGDVGAAVYAWVQEWQRLAAEHAVSLHVQGLEQLGSIAFHESMLRRALLNLVQNALDAMPEGGHLVLEGHGTATHVQLQVRDTGSGIPAPQQAQIFEPLYTTKPGGTGLGLYIVQQIVAAHEGEIRVESTIDQGTLFTLTLPRTPAAASLPDTLVASPAATGRE
ncbi:MAG: ATP-binding protein [Candidatus Tectimicrobiota bacterium]